MRSSDSPHLQSQWSPWINVFIGILLGILVTLSIFNRLMQDKILLIQFSPKNSITTSQSLASQPSDSYMISNSTNSTSIHRVSIREAYPVIDFISNNFLNTTWASERVAVSFNSTMISQNLAFQDSSVVQVNSVASNIYSRMRNRFSTSNNESENDHSIFNRVKNRLRKEKNETKSKRKIKKRVTRDEEDLDNGKLILPEPRFDETRLDSNSMVVNTQPWIPGHEGQFLKSKSISDSPHVDEKKVIKEQKKMKRKRLRGKDISFSNGREEYTNHSLIWKQPTMIVAYFFDSEIKQLDSVFLNTSQLEDYFTKPSSYPYTLYPSPPLIPYHDNSQITSMSETFLETPYAPSVSYIEFLMKQITEIKSHGVTLPSYWDMQLQQGLPDMTLQKATFERDNLKLHLCNGVNEAYSASYLTTRQHMIEVDSMGYNLSWVNCEMASFIHMRESKKFLQNPQASYMILQTLDVLDFSVVHLSTFERSSKKYMYKLWNSTSERKSQWSKIYPITKASELLETKFHPNISKSNMNWSEEAKKTVVIMPFLGGAMGAGHSELGNRFQYLKLCFWSFYEFFPNIVMGVSRQEDVEWGFQSSGLPFYDILLLENLPKSASLPVATTQETKRRLQSGKWTFDYVFFTESDQILIARQLPMLFSNLKEFPGRMLLPHRLMVYSDRILREIHQRELATIKKPNEWMGQSCCIQRQNCMDRKTWVSLKDSKVPIINYYGLYIPLGNVNFLDEMYRSCDMSSYIGSYCP